MASPALSLRAAFLAEATHLLAPTAPTTSAFLGSARDRLLVDAELDLTQKERDALRRESCGACGTLLVPGWTCSVSHRSQSAPQRKGKKDAKTAARPDKVLVYTCLRCARETAQSLVLRAPRHVAKKARVVAPAAVEVKKPSVAANVDEDGRVGKSLNASSKQRKKARKGGLAAMLEKSKAQSQGSGGLDLMDFAM